MNDQLYTYYSPQQPIMGAPSSNDSTFTGTDQIFVHHYLPDGFVGQPLPPNAFHQMPVPGYVNNQPSENSFSSSSSSMIHPGAAPQHLYPPDFSDAHNASQPAGLAGSAGGFQGEVLFPNLSTDLSMEKKIPAPVQLQEVYPTPDEPHFPHSTFAFYNNNVPPHEPMSTNFPSMSGAISQPTSPLQSPASSVSVTPTNQRFPQPVNMLQQYPQQGHSISSTSSHNSSEGSPIFKRVGRTPRNSKTSSSKSRAKSNPEIMEIHTSQPGPIPASKPTLKYDHVTGEEHLTFSYSRHKIITTFTVKCPATRVDPKELPEDFLKENCVYPRAMVPVEEYKGNRGRYERECNEIGWTLAWSNPEIRNHRGLVQRAVDSWRNTRTDKAMRSRRVRKTEVKK